MRRTLAGLSAAGCLLVLGACGEAVSTSHFSGEQRNVAQAVSDFQKDVTAADEGKLCGRDIAAGVTARLKGANGGCQAVLKGQLREIDSLTLTVESISVNGSTAVALVKSTWSGTTRKSALSLVKEAGRWKISGTR